MSVSIRDRYRGCIVGQAVGDALGAPAEFLSLDEIRATFGPDGVTDLAPWHRFPAGSFTDDTQMAIATASGTLRALNRGRDMDIWDTIGVVHGAYVRWFETQTDPEQRRAPGHSCLGMLGSGRYGVLVDRRVDDDPSPDILGRPSKGAGGIMRAAPAGLVLTSDGAFTWGCDIAALTHTHPSGYLPAGFLAGMVDLAIHRYDLETSVQALSAELIDWPDHEETLAAVHSALEAVGTDAPDFVAITRLGGAWVGEEALAVTLLCALRHPDDWSAAVLAAVNHGGDSDTTGATVGALLGATLGVEAIPARWVEQVERRDELLQLADDLYRAFCRGHEVSRERYPGF